MSCDWETVKNVVPGNSSMKPDQTGGDGKGVKQSEMFNYSVYSRLGNNKFYGHGSIPYSRHHGCSEYEISFFLHFYLYISLLLFSISTHPSF